MAYIPPGLPQEAKEQLTEFHERSRVSPDELYEQNIRGAMETSQSQMGKPKDLIESAKSSGMDLDENRASSIYSKSATPYYNQMDELKYQTRRASADDYYGRLLNATDLAGREAELNDRIIQAKYLARMKKRAARKQTMGAILGISGAFIGGAMMAGAGPAGVGMGAMAGMNIGRAVGSY